MPNTSLKTGRRKTTPDERSDIGKILRSIRIGKDITQKDLAERLGVTKGAVSNWESGISRPDLAYIPSICSILDVPAGKLMGMPDDLEELSGDERTHLSLYRRLSKRDRQNIHSLMEAMLENEQQEFRETCDRHFRRLPLLADKVCAGSGIPLDNAGNISSVFIRSTPSSEKADAVITVTGDSMESTFHDGDQLLIHWTESLLPGEIGIFVLNGEGTVKEYQPDGLHPHNPAYPVLHPEEGDSFRCVGRVLTAVTDAMFPDKTELSALEDLWISRNRF